MEITKQHFVDDKNNKQNCMQFSGIFFLSLILPHLLATINTTLLLDDIFLLGCEIESAIEVHLNKMQYRKFETASEIVYGTHTRTHAHTNCN